MFKAPNYDSKKKLKHAPEMWMSEIKYLEDLLVKKSINKKVLKILEWGSGNGTIHFVNFLKKKKIKFKWVSIEHFIPWFEKVIIMFHENRILKNVKCYLFNATYETDKLKQEKMDLKDYINPPIEDKNFDFILIDGRRREDCLKSALKYVSKDGVVIMHDAEREWYLKCRNLYKNNGEIVVTNVSPNSRRGVQKLWVGYKKK